MFNPTRDQARQFFFTTWRKYQTKESLSDLERITLAILLQHPEYHSLLNQPELALDRDYLPEMGQSNPFLHLSMHLAIEEQIRIDQPAGVRAHYERLIGLKGSAHEAIHLMMDCLGEMIWQAQCQGTSPDATVYLSCLASSVVK